MLVTWEKSARSLASSPCVGTGRTQAMNLKSITCNTEHQISVLMVATSHLNIYIYLYYQLWSIIVNYSELIQYRTFDHNMSVNG
jgi:hypothetical protein